MQAPGLSHLRWARACQCCRGMTLRGMRFLAAVSSLVLISSCAPVRETVVPGPAAALPGKEIAAANGKPEEPSRSVMEPPRRQAAISPASFRGRLRSMPAATGSWSPISRAARARISRMPPLPGAPAAASPQSTPGFSRPTGKPLGLVVSSGKPSGAWNSASSLGSGVWHENPAGNPAIRRREALGRSGAATMRELIQAGPMLVENGRLVAGLDPIKSSVRTFILWDGGSRWWLGQASPCTLAELAAALAPPNPPAGQSPRAQSRWRPLRRSLDFRGACRWPRYPTAAWNRPVRNFLVLVPRNDRAGDEIAIKRAVDSLMGK